MIRRVSCSLITSDKAYIPKTTHRITPSGCRGPAPRALNWNCPLISLPVLATNLYFFHLIEKNSCIIVLCDLYCAVHSHVIHSMWRPVCPFNEMPGDLMEAEEIFEKLRLELRRGAIVLAVLAQLRKEHYGYSLRKELISLGIEIDEGTLYPLLRRLEKQGLLWSEWREEDKRQKRFYRISEIGEDVLNRLTEAWSHLNSRISTMLEGDES